MVRLRFFLVLAVCALSYSSIIDSKMNSKARNLSGVRAIISDFIVTRFVKDMRSTIDELVTSRTPSMNQSDQPQVAGYLSAQMTSKDEKKKKPWKSKIKNILKMKDGVVTEQYFKKLEPSVEAIKKKESNPLVIFINKKSGGHVGSTLLERLKPTFPSAQVCDLSMHSASDYLKLYSNCTNLRVLICGGDGTVGWIMDEMKKVYPTHNCSFGVVPLGTGNDLCIQLRDVTQSSNAVIEGAKSNLGNKVNSVKKENVQIANSDEVINSLSVEINKSDERIVINLLPNMVITDPKLLTEYYKSPKIVQLDRWAVKVQRVHGRKRKLLKLLLIQNKVKRRGNSIISGLARFISNMWRFTRDLKQAKDEKIMVADHNNRSIDASQSLKDVTVGKDTIKKIPLKKKKKELMNFTMNNYLGVGVDGAVTLGFHSLRQKVPALFFSRWVNKVWYGVVGLRTLQLGWSRDLSQCCQLVCDGQVVKIPPGTQSIIMLNINSYAGGMKMWPDAGSLYYLGQNGESGLDGRISAFKSDFVAAGISDGLIEIVAVSGINHLGAIKAGLRRATPIAQGRNITLTSTASLPVQLDGEPWRQKPCKMDISLSERVNLMLPTVKKVT